jgi:ABC-type glycerol-3-phosphate transport system substrate-binding protein
MNGMISSVLALVLATGLVAACGSNDSTDPATTAAPAAVTTETAAATTAAAPTTTQAAPATTAEPEVLTIEVVGEKPVDGVARLRVKKGERIHFIVESDSAQEVHLHGYDVVKDAAPGAPAEFNLKATIDGVFEAELEGPGVQILKLTVEP